MAAIMEYFGLNDDTGDFIDFDILDECCEIIPATREQWIDFFNDLKKYIGHDIINEILISTCFYGINNDWFKTTLFYKDAYGEYGKYDTYQDALEGHKNACKHAMNNEFMIIYDKDLIPYVRIVKMKIENI